MSSIDMLVKSSDPLMVFCSKAMVVSIAVFLAVLALISVWVVVDGVWGFVKNWYERWSWTREQMKARERK